MIEDQSKRICKISADTSRKMGVEVANCLHRPPAVSPSASCPQTPSPSSVNSQFERKKRFPSSSSTMGCCGKSNALFVNSLYGFQNSVWSVGRREQLNRMRSFKECKRPRRRLKRTCSACLGDISDDDYLQRLQEMALQCHISDDNEEETSKAAAEQPRTASVNHNQKGLVEGNRIGENSMISVKERNTRFEHTGSLNSRPFPSAQPDNNFCWPEPDWNKEGINVSRISPVTLEKKADGVGLPLSLRMLKRKQYKERGIRPKPEGFRNNLAEVVSESACCSVRKAFSSMVFIIRELQSYTLQMRQILCYGDLQELVSSVQKEMHASFVWLFQQVFSCTPTLMVSVMILLANFTVYSMGNNVALASIPSIESPTATISVLEDGIGTGNMGLKEALAKFVAENPSGNKLSNLPSPQFVDLSPEQGLLNMGDGSGGSGGTNSAIAGGADGDAHFDGASQNQAMFLEDNSVKPPVTSFANPTSTKDGGSIDNKVEESVPVDQISEEIQKWEAFVKEAFEELEFSTKDEALDHKTMQRFVSPISVQLEPDNYVCYDRTNLHYQQAIGSDPDNPLLLSNYAQFLHLVAHDHDRAEEYFQRAMKLDPSDGEVIGKYAHFLWLARADLSSAEEAFLDAIAADPTNPFHAGSYAHFLWNTGGEDTCYPLA